MQFKFSLNQNSMFYLKQHNRFYQLNQFLFLNLDLFINLAMQLRLKASFFLILCLSMSISAQQIQYTLQRVSQQNGASCLDGTSPAYYFHEGQAQNKNKFLLHFQAGGFCGQKTLSETLQSCYQRSLTSFGSTKNRQEKLNATGTGMMSPYKQQNPSFFDWTKIFILYCDGSEYQGHLNGSLAYKDTKLFFRGKKNVLQDKFDIYNKDTIIISGISAGGIATYFWSNYLVENTKTSKVIALPDSGLFLTQYFSPIANQQVLRDRIIPLMNLVNGSKQFTIQECIRDFNGDIVPCFNSANSAKYLKAPMFIIQSNYDQWSLHNNILAECLTNKNPPFSLQTCNQTTIQIIQDHKNKSILQLIKLKNNRNDVGLWSPSCVQHGFMTYPWSFDSQNFRVPSGNGITLIQAINEFLTDTTNAKWYMDSVSWPNNKGCNGLTSKNRYNIRISSSDLVNEKNSLWNLIQQGIQMQRKN